MDPTQMEEAVQSGSVLVGVTNYRELCSLLKAGGVAIEMDKILHFSDLAFTQVGELTRIIQEQIKADMIKRKLCQN
jgi:exosome complex RNA-binding protein Rrp42 (RNase PH superfamily)